MQDYPEIHCEFGTLEELYAAYMPFVTGGGLFVHYGRRDTDKPVALNSKVTLKIKLPDDELTETLTAKIIWIDLGEDVQVLKGVGIQFPEEAAGLRDKIDELLKEQLLNGDETQTL